MSDRKKVLGGAAMTVSWVTSEYLQDRLDARGCEETLRKAYRRYNGRMYRCAKRFGFSSTEEMREVLRHKAAQIVAEEAKQ